jgi:hypothetical protein
MSKDKLDLLINQLTFNRILDAEILSSVHQCLAIILEHDRSFGTVEQYLIDASHIHIDNTCLSTHTDCFTVYNSFSYVIRQNHDVNVRTQVENNYDLVLHIYVCIRMQNDYLHRTREKVVEKLVESHNTSDDDRTHRKALQMRTLQ